LFGDSVATLLGDLALSEATLLVADASPPVRALWRRMSVELVQGQLLDVTQAASRQRGMAAARRIARLKSGRYTRGWDVSGSQQHGRPRPPTWWPEPAPARSRAVTRPADREAPADRSARAQ
jgi:geranylgeranyl diphosphate synthase type I